MPEFGWSVGDAVAGVDLIVKSIDFLIVAFGASKEHRAFADELRSHKAVFQICKAIDRNSLQARARVQFDECMRQYQNALDVLAHELSKYDWTIGSRILNSSTWTALSRRKVVEVRERLSGCVALISLIADTGTFNGVSKTNTTLDRLESNLNYDITNLASSLVRQDALTQSNHDNLRAILARQEATMTSDHQELRSILARQEASAISNHQEQCSSQALLKQDLNSVQSDLSVDLLAGFDMLSTSHYNLETRLAQMSSSNAQLILQAFNQRMDAMDMQVATAMRKTPVMEQRLLHGFHDFLQRNHNRLNGNFKSISVTLRRVFDAVRSSHANCLVQRDRNDISGQIIPFLETTDAHCQTVFVRRDIGSSQLVFRIRLQIWLRELAQLFFALLLTFSSAFVSSPRYSAMLRLAQNHVKFYDALGRDPIIIELDICLNVKTLHQFLLGRFRNIPGEAHVQERQYMIFREGMRELSSNEITGRTDAKAGMVLYMMMIVDRDSDSIAVGASDERCPKSDCEGFCENLHDGQRTCNECGLVFHRLGSEQTERKVLGPGWSDHHQILDLQMFGRSFVLERVPSPKPNNGSQHALSICQEALGSRAGQVHRKHQTHGSGKGTHPTRGRVNDRDQPNSCARTSERVQNSEDVQNTSGIIQAIHSMSIVSTGQASATECDNETISEAMRRETRTRKSSRRRMDIEYFRRVLISNKASDLLLAYGRAYQSVHAIWQRLSTLRRYWRDEVLTKTSSITNERATYNEAKHILIGNLIRAKAKLDDIWYEAYSRGNVLSLGERLLFDRLSWMNVPSKPLTPTRLSDPVLQKGQTLRIILGGGEYDDLSFSALSTELRKRYGIKRYHANEEVGPDRELTWARPHDSIEVKLYDPQVIQDIVDGVCYFEIELLRPDGMRYPLGGVFRCVLCSIGLPVQIPPPSVSE